jgi:hypothetical protein
MAGAAPKIFTGCRAAVGMPHSGQNLALSKIFASHPLHFSDVDAPQDGQTLEGLSPSSRVQLKHFIGYSKNMQFLNFKQFDGMPIYTIRDLSLKTIKP